ncbi:MAG: chemotaxis response regulator protein-glutamate methylesterase [Verrucomicrobia bacterium]|nr:chemotaxis response regulator protein-glutamate methylesterase [Verrucomicrobiota bacterium]MBU1735579.1 chemotaxis response regulator protein-glutamate methylesterase [Verrucomicrobiota bacterium]
MEQRKIRVLVVDDSALMRKIISDIINSDPECEVAATARNGEEAVKSTAILRPDVITLDIQLPKMDGISALKYIMSEWPTPVVIVTGLTQFLGEDTLKCLEYGAVDLVIKPSGPISLDFEIKKDELLQKVKAASRVRRNLLKPVFVKTHPIQKKINNVLSDKIVVIATSTGGPKALATILPILAPDIKAGLIVIQHMPEGFTRSMAERLNAASRLIIKEAEDGDSVTHGMVMIAPGGRHLMLDKTNDGVKIKLLNKSRENELCPSADIAMQSAAPLYGRNCLGVILTGMGSDGVEGLKAIKQAGGSTIAEDEVTCIVYGMPKIAAEQKVVDKIFPLPEIAAEIMKWAE